MAMIVNDSLAELAIKLGGISPHRIRRTPRPDTATIDDAIAAADRGELVELVDGTMIEKAFHFAGSVISATLSGDLGQFVHHHDLGCLAGGKGLVEIRRR